MMKDLIHSRIASMRSRALGFCLSVAVVSTIGAIVHGCGPMCNDIDCSSGLYVDIIMDDRGALPVGDYVVSIEVEDTSVQYHCAIRETHRDSVCDDPDISDETLFLDFFFGVKETSADGENNVDTSGRPPTHFVLRAFYEVEDDSIQGSYRGPERVAVRFEIDGVLVAEQTYTPEFERDKDYYGDEECGFCESEVTRELILIRPAVD